VLAATGVGVLALVDADENARAVGFRLVAVGLLALIAAVALGWTALVPASVVALGAAYATHLAVDDPALDVRAPLVAAGLLLTAELGYWSIEERDRVRGEEGEGLRQLGLVTLLVLGGLAVSAALLAVADLARTQGLAIDLLGAAAAAGALLVLALVARRPRPQ
jgi:hypothetical protein